jgi:hypothetical protein
MTKYDYIFNSQAPLAAALSPEEAVAAIAVITAVVDASVENVDGEILADILCDFEIFDEYSDAEILEIVDRLMAIAEDAGLASLFNSANPSLTDEYLLDAFAAGVMMLLEEDLTIAHATQPYLQELQAALELEDNEAKEIIQQIIAAIEAAEAEQQAEYQPIILDDLGQELYESPLGNFTVPIPVNSAQGGKVQSQPGIVGFSDDFGTLLRIDYYPLSPEQLAEIESIGYENHLQTILVEKYVPQVIVANVPQAQIRYSEYLADVGDGAYYVLVDLPKGSTISKQETNGLGRRLDAYRGLIAFVNGDFLYVISGQRSFFDGDTPATIELEAQDIQDKILDFIETIDFMEI